MQKYTSCLEYFKLFLFSIYMLFLPIAHTAAVQSISLGLFIFLILICDFRNLNIKNLLYLKNLIIVFLLFLVVSYFSLFYTVDFKESLKEINSELLKKIVVMLFMFLYFSTLPKNKIKYYIFIIFAVFIVHTLINLFTWYLSGFSLSTRTGGLLDGYLHGGGGERFAIWACYAFAFSLGVFYFLNKKVGFLCILLSLISIFTTHVRASYLASLILIVIFVFMFIKSKFIKFGFVFLLLSIFVGLYDKTSSLNNRYNVAKAVDYINLLQNSPQGMGEEYKQKNLDFSISSRLSMWKAALLYKSDSIFTPSGYGRFLYGKTIRLADKENQPFAIFAQVHNEFMGIFFSLGFFGLIIFLFIWYFYFKFGLNLMKNSTENLYKFFGFFGFLGGISFVINLVFGSFFGDSEAAFFYVLFGMICAILLNGDKNENLTYKK
ncbi:MAG: O-antigen ligase family protein [Campylobacter hyointestinalis]